MKMYVGVVLFWMSIFGYLLIFKEKTKLPYVLLLPIIFSLIGIIIFIAGILNMMLEIALIVCFLGIMIFGYKIIKKEVKFKKLFNVNFFILFTIFLYLTIVCGKMHLMHYDNFSHWGLIVKNMFLDNRLPNFENPVIDFKSYQPGSACFIYYVGLLTGKSEGSMIIAQNYLLASYFFSLLVFTDSKRQQLHTRKKYILKIMLVSLYLFMLFGNIMFNDLLVDTLIAVMSLCSFVILYYFKDDLTKAFKYNLPILIYLFLVKNTGIVLVGFSCLGLISLGFRNKQLKKGLIYAILSGVIPVLFFYIWTKHVSYVFGDLSLYSKHSLSTSNIIGELRNKGWDRIFEFCNIYWNHFIDIYNNTPNKYIIGINIVIILMLILYKKHRKYFCICLGITNSMYFMYYLILGVMYLLSMPWGEARNLASFDRYMMTIIFIIIGITLIGIINIIIKDRISNKSCIVVVSLITIILYINLKYHITDYKVLVGNIDYNNSLAYKFDYILETDKYNSLKTDYYYIYAPISSNNDYGYTYYLSRYKLNTPNVLIVSNIEQLSQEIDNTYTKKIIILDSDEDITNYIGENNYIKEGNIYKLKKE